MVVHSPQSFHVARVADDGLCTAIEPLADSAIWFNAGYFAFRRQIFDYIHAGDELVMEPFQRLIAERQLPGASVPRLLAGDGHLQGSAGPRSAARTGRRALAALELQPPGVQPGGG